MTKNQETDVQKAAQVSAEDQVLLSAVAQNNFGALVEYITDLQDHQDDGYEKTRELLVTILPFYKGDSVKTLAAIKKVAEIYLKNKANVAQLEDGYILFASQFGKGIYPVARGSSGAVPQNLTKEVLVNWDANKVSQTLKQVREEYTKCLANGLTLPAHLVEVMNILLDEQVRRNGGGDGTKKHLEIKQSTQEENGLGVTTDVKPGHYKFWFIRPTDGELSASLTTEVICGSPVTSILRRYYKHFYKLKVIQEVTDVELAKSNTERQFELHKELNKQQEFVAKYFHCEDLDEQDICVNEIHNECCIDQYVNVKRYSEDNNYKGVYVFKGGKFILRFNERTNKYSLKVEGNIPGSFTLIIRRQEKYSKRSISDAYDIVEFRNGVVVFYFFSSKGVSAFDDGTLSGFRTVMRGLILNLTAPVVAEYGDQNAINQYLQEKTKREEVLKNSDQSDDLIPAATLNQATSAPEPQSATVSDEGGEKKEVPIKVEKSVDQEVPKNLEGEDQVVTSVLEVASSNDVAFGGVEESSDKSTGLMASNPLIEEPESQAENTKPSELQNNANNLSDVIASTQDPEPLKEVPIQEAAQVSAKDESASDVVIESKTQGTKMAVSELSVLELRKELQKGIEQKFATSTLKYLVAQIAAKEGKTSEEIETEIALQFPQITELLKPEGRVKILKERAKQLQESITEKPEDQQG